MKFVEDGRRVLGTVDKNFIIKFSPKQLYKQYKFTISQFKQALNVYDKYMFLIIK